MASLFQFSSSDRSEEEHSSRPEVKSVWANGGPDAPGSTSSAVEPPLYEQSPQVVHTSTSSTPAAQTIELESFPSTATKAEVEQHYNPRAELPSVGHADEPPAKSPLREKTENACNVRVGGGGRGTGAGAVAVAGEDKEPPLSVWRKLCYAMGAIPFTFTQAAMGFYFTVFMLEVIKVCVLQSIGGPQAAA